MLGSACAELITEGILHRSQIGFALEDRGDIPAPVDEEIHRKAENAAVRPGEADIAHQDGIIHGPLTQERAHRLRIIVKRDGNNLQAVWAISRLPINEPGHLHQARSAPGRPKRQQNNLAAESC